MDRTPYRRQDGQQRIDRVPGRGQACLPLEHHHAERKSEQQAAHDDEQGIIELLPPSGPYDTADSGKKRAARD
jgi:hypothetical protein